MGVQEYHKCAREVGKCKGLNKGIKGYHECAKKANCKKVDREKVEKVKENLKTATAKKTISKLIKKKIELKNNKKLSTNMSEQKTTSSSNKIPKCGAITKSGKPCKNNQLDYLEGGYNGYCGIHRFYKPQKVVEEKQAVVEETKKETKEKKVVDNTDSTSVVMWLRNVKAFNKHYQKKKIQPEVNKLSYRPEGDFKNQIDKSAIDAYKKVYNDKFKQFKNAQKIFIERNEHYHYKTIIKNNDGDKQIDQLMLVNENFDKWVKNAYYNHTTYNANK
jgi:hypothetical protein